MPVRLKNAVLRIVARSKHRAYYLPQKEQAPGAPTPPHVRMLTSAPQPAGAAHKPCVAACDLGIVTP